jgi:L-fuculose-phosphate aldolase
MVVPIADRYEVFMTDITVELGHNSIVEAREALVLAYREMSVHGLGVGASGNVSQRISGGMLITPTGIEAEQMLPEQAVAMSLNGDCRVNQLLPSSEWHMHGAIYKERPEVQAIVHCHSRYATILACARKAVPALHYMIAITGSNEIPVAPYATFGTDSLANAVVSSLKGRLACLLANHGQIALGCSLQQAIKVAVEVEELSALFWGTLAIGGGHCLSDTEMEEVKVAFSGYGQQRGRIV